jgi:hypothetical protein
MNLQKQLNIKMRNTEHLKFKFSVKEKDEYNKITLKIKYINFEYTKVYTLRKYFLKDDSIDTIFKYFSEKAINHCELDRNTIIYTNSKEILELPDYIKNVIPHISKLNAVKLMIGYGRDHGSSKETWRLTNAVFTYDHIMNEKPLTRNT